MSAAIGEGWGVPQAPDTRAVQRGPRQMNRGRAAGRSQNSLLMPQQQKRAELCLLSFTQWEACSADSGQQTDYGFLLPIDCHLPERILTSASSP